MIYVKYPEAIKNSQNTVIRKYITKKLKRFTLKDIRMANKHFY